MHFRTFIVHHGSGCKKQNRDEVKRLMLAMTSSLPGQERSHRSIGKTISLAMKFTAILLLVATLGVSAKGFTQTISVSGKNVTLDKVFARIKKQTDYTFVYTETMLQKASRLSINISNASIEQVLQLCFANQPLSYTILNKMVIIKDKQESPKENATDDQPSIPATVDISGKITNEEGRPLQGASIKLKGTDKGTTTNSSGIFILKGVDENAILEISFVGYQTIFVSVNNQTSIAASLKQKEDKLNEIIVNKGYYTEKQKTSISNVATVTSNEIEKQPVGNPLLALQGRVPGLFILQPSGIAGSSVKVRIQGQNSIANGNNPLYVVDGVPVISEFPITGIDAVLASPGANYSGYGNPLNYIDMSSIESIDVLKDADATAIYGSRAANGAILITTKKGKAGAMRFDIDMQTGFGKVANKVDMLNTRQYLDMRYEAFANDGINWKAPFVDANDLKVWDTTRYTDWQKALIGGTANITKINAGVSGGTNLVRYLIAGTYQKQTTVFPISNDFADTKGSVNFNINANSLNQKLQLQFTGNYMYDHNQLPGFDLTQNALLLEPNAPPLYNPDGTINWAPNASGSSTFSYNPMLLALRKYWNKTANLISNLSLSYKVLSGLDFKTSIGYNSMHTTDFRAGPMAIVPPELRVNAQRSAEYGNRDINSWIAEPQLSYHKTIGKGSFGAILGGTLLNLNTSSGYVRGVGHLSDDLLENMNAAATLSKGFASASQYKYVAGFGRINYNWKEKYIINFSGRRDGSSRFGDQNKFHNFGSIGAGWVFSYESFINKNFSFLSFGKLRGSYGTTGNDQIGDYQYLSLYNFPPIDVAYQGVVSIRPSGLPNPHLQWEETKKLQIGLDLSFLQDKITLSSTYIRNRSSSQLITYVIPGVTGFQGYLTNFPATIQNTSWEFTAGSKNITGKNFNWISNFNLTIPRNKLISFPGLEASSYANDLVVGKSIRSQRLLHFVGVDPGTGRNSFQSKTDPFNPRYPDDYTVYQNLDPTLYGGLQNTLTWKAIELDFLFQFVKQTGYNDLILWNGNRAPGSFFPGLSNQPVSVLERWQKPGDLTRVEKYYTGGGAPSTVRSDYRFTDASYIRLKNVSLSWEMPGKWMNKIHFKRCKLYVHGQNLWTITNYKGLDPEVQSGWDGSVPLPPLRVITTGIQLGF
jgi:TonB-dependent starch-binding outer membrane protein SusC